MSFTAALGTVGAGLVGKLLTAGLQKIGTLAFQKALRILRIESNLKGAIKQNPLVATAISDFETVLGSRYNQLTSQVSTFFSDLERSGVITAMVETALLGDNRDRVFPIFDRMHGVAFDSNGDSKLLYDKLMSSFTITLQELSKDRVLFELVKAIGNDLRNRLDQIEDAVKTISLDPADWPSKTIDSLIPHFTKIAKALQQSYKTIRIETNKGPRDVDISKIYIPSKLSYRPNSATFSHITALSKYVASEKLLQLSDRSGILASGEHVQAALSTLQYTELRLNFNRVVILGDPGGGKSTLCQYICQDLGKQVLANLPAQKVSPDTPQLRRFPIRIILRQFEKARSQAPQLGLFEFICKDLPINGLLEYKEISTCLKYLLATGSAAIAVDGLDEILVTAQRREFVDLVVSFSNQFPLCPVLVTSRLVGYDEAPLPNDFEQLLLEKFDDEEVLRYAGKFMKVVAQKNETDAELFAQRFISQTEINANDLRRNPLMLGLMLWIFHSRGDVPSNWPEIYRECAVLMFERWDPDRNIRAEIPKDFDRLQLFTQLASKVFPLPELSAGVDAQWLEREVKSYFEELYQDKAKAFEAAKSVVKFITGRAWVMSEKGDGVYAFTHQTFLEYFFARHIDDICDTVENVFDTMREKIIGGEWDVVAHLSFKLKRTEICVVKTRHLIT